MHAQHIIILVGLAACFLLLTLFIRRAIKRALRRSYWAGKSAGNYVITHGADGKPFTKTQQVHMCGNSVSPPPMAALAKANDPWRQTQVCKEAA